MLENAIAVVENYHAYFMLQEIVKMGPMRKDVLDKAAWAWVDSTEPSAVTLDNVVKAYRIQLPECQPGTCR